MKVAIYCGSSLGNNQNIINKTKELGKYLALNGVDLVYGGGSVGLMGVIADSFLEHGAKVYGVIPKKLKDRELAHTKLTELIVVETMSERKAKMLELSDAFIALPGGIGTLEEMFEAFTLTQLGYHQKPCAFYNIDGFYDKLFGFLHSISDNEFLNRDYIDNLINTQDEKTLLESIKSYTPPKVKWT